MTHCKNCKTAFDSKFCPECGSVAQVKRINKQYLIHELQHGILHVESGFFFTSKELILRPGQMILGFLQGNRAKHYKPIGYVIICSIIYTLVGKLVHLKVKADSPIGNINKIVIWISENTNYSNLIEIVFLALALQLFFKKREYNYFEYIVLFCYLTGSAILISTIFLLIASALKNASINNYAQIGVFGYMIWGIAKFFKANKFSTYFRSFLAYFVGLAMFVAAAILLALILKFLGIKL
jgi:Protein of unknown function (DUF3667)